MGLSILRLAAASFLFHDSLNSFAAAATVGQAVVPGLTATAAALLLAGVWTPIVGSLIALLEFWRLSSRPSESWAPLLVAAMALALALLGPGAWSIDAVKYGRKRISIRERQSSRES